MVFAIKLLGPRSISIPFKTCEISQEHRISSDSQEIRLKQQDCLEDCIRFSGSVCPGLEPDLLYCCLEFHSKCDIIIVYQMFFKQIAEKECHFLFNAPLKYQKFNEYPKHLMGKMHYKYLYKKLSRSLNTKSFLNFLLSLSREALF